MAFRCEQRPRQSRKARFLPTPANPPARYIREVDQPRFVLSPERQSHSHRSSANPGPLKNAIAAGACNQKLLEPRPLRGTNKRPQIAFIFVSEGVVRGYFHLAFVPSIESYAGRDIFIGCFRQQSSASDATAKSPLNFYFFEFPTYFLLSFLSDADGRFRVACAVLDRPLATRPQLIARLGEKGCFSGSGSLRKFSSIPNPQYLFLNSEMRPDSVDPARTSVSQYQSAHRSRSPSGKPRPSSPTAC